MNEKKRKFNLIEKLLENKTKFIYLGVLCIISIIFYLLLYFFKGNTFYDQVDNSFIVAFSFFLFGCMSIVNNQGFFDMMYYGFSLMFTLFKNEERKYIDLIDYKERTADKRNKDSVNFIFYFAIALVYFIVFLYFYISYKVNF